VLILVRHGRTAANAAGLLLGRLDAPLDHLGELQAKATAEHLGATLAPSVRVLSSPLQRARDTAAQLGLPVEVDERLVELDYGTLDGVPASDVDAALWQRWRVDATFTPPGGESLTTLSARVRAVCEEVAPDAMAGDVVLVSHVSPIKGAVAWALGTGIEVSWRCHLDPASVSRVACTPSGPVLHTFNETAHLQR
jgi:broad specificity phosphatase PhoE